MQFVIYFFYYQKYRNFVLLKALFESIFLSFLSCSMISYVTRKIRIFPFFPLLYIIMEWREDRILELYCEEWFNHVAFDIDSVLGKEKLRLETILSKIYNDTKIYDRNYL